MSAERVGSRLIDSNPWPAECCVPAFVHAGLIELGVAPPARDFVARTLGVRVGPGDVNPFALAVSSDPFGRGVTPEDAAIRLAPMLDQIAPTLAFRHVYFDTIMGGLYEDVLEEALAHCIVGVGVSPSRLSIPAVGETRHLVRITEKNGTNLSLRDDSKGIDLDVAWDSVESAVRNVRGGYWCLGPIDGLGFRFCLPWRR